MNTSPENTMTVVVTMNQYRELRDAQLRLRALERAGVDNWDGYSYAMTVLRKLRVKEGLPKYEDGDDDYDDDEEE